MIITTKSGATYEAEVKQTSKGPCLFASRNGDKARPVIAIFPDRLPFLQATASTEWNGHQVIGYNGAGTVTLKFDPAKVLRGMILANRRGLRSTEIVAVV